MPEYGITETGLRIKRLDVILEEINADQTAGFGVKVGTNQRSFLNVLNTSFADKIAELWEFGAEIYHSLSPMSAEGPRWTMRYSSEGTVGRSPRAPTTRSIVNVPRVSPWTKTR